MLELVEEAFDEVALAIDAPVNRAMDQPLSGRRNVGSRAARPDQFEERVGVVAAVGNDMAALQTGKQMWCRPQVVSLTGGQHESHRQAVLIDKGVDLGAQSSTRATDGVIFALFFLAPAACWWARMIELSIKAIEWGDLAAKVSKICTQTPALAQRLKRL